MQERFAAIEKEFQFIIEDLRRRVADLDRECDRVNQMQATYMPRETYDARHAILTEKVEMVERFKANMEGRMWIGGAAILIIAALMAAAARFLK